MEKVRTLLRKFQDGYTRRDQSHLDEFMELFTAGDDLEIIGTNAVEMGKDEWCLGRAAVREVVARDWKYWGDVVFNVDGARISIKENVAWIATTGTVTDTITMGERHSGYLEYVRGVLEDQEMEAQAKMLDIVRLGNDIVIGLLLGETCEWPFRFTAVAVKEDDGEWRFHQMQFSFATTRSPDVRNR